MILFQNVRYEYCPSVLLLLCAINVLLLHVYSFLQFSQMIKLYHSLGPEKFPLNEQCFYPNHTQMVSGQFSFTERGHTQITLDFLRPIFIKFLL